MKKILLIFTFLFLSQYPFHANGMERPVIRVSTRFDFHLIKGITDAIKTFASSKHTHGIALATLVAVLCEVLLDTTLEPKQKNDLQQYIKQNKKMTHLFFILSSATYGSFLSRKAIRGDQIAFSTIEAGLFFAFINILWDVFKTNDSLRRNIKQKLKIFLKYASIEAIAFASGFFITRRLQSL